MTSINKVLKVNKIKLDNKIIIIASTLPLKIIAFIPFNIPYVSEPLDEVSLKNTASTPS